MVQRWGFASTKVQPVFADSGLLFKELASPKLMRNQAFHKPVDRLASRLP